MTHLPFVTIFSGLVFDALRAGRTHDPFTRVWGRQPRGRGAARLQSPFPFRVFSPSPPLSSFSIPLYTAPKAAHSHDAAQNGNKQIYFMKSWEPPKNIRSPQEWGELWKRERERKPVRGERISIVRCALSPLKEVVARTPVDGSCVTHPVHQIESHTSPQEDGKPVLREWSTQSIKDNTQETGHRSKTLLRKNSTQSIKDRRKTKDHKQQRSKAAPNT